LEDSPLAFPPQQGPGGQLYSGRPQGNSGSGCLKAAGISCLVLLVLIIGGVALMVHTVQKSGFMSSFEQEGKSLSDGFVIYKAITTYRAKNGGYPPDLTSLVPDYLPDGKILHSPADAVSTSPGHISWEYFRPTASTPPDAALLDLPYVFRLPVQPTNMPPVKGDFIITVDGKQKSSTTTPGVTPGSGPTPATSTSGGSAI